VDAFPSRKANVSKAREEVLIIWAASSTPRLLLVSHCVLVSTLGHTFCNI
jgi:hypothetical protein